MPAIQWLTMMALLRRYLMLVMVSLFSLSSSSFISSDEKNNWTGNIKRTGQAASQHWLAVPSTTTSDLSAFRSRLFQPITHQRRTCNCSQYVEIVCCVVGCHGQMQLHVYIVLVRTPKLSITLLTELMLAANNSGPSTEQAENKLPSCELFDFLLCWLQRIFQILQWLKEDRYSDRARCDCVQAD